MDNNTKASVYVELDALANWNSQMNNINESAISILNSLVSTTKDLDEYWTSNIASGFLKDADELIQSATKCHNQMKDVAVFLTELAKVMDNQ